MQAEGKVGLISVSSGSVNPLRTNTEGALVTTLGSAGKYGDLVIADKVFAATSTAAVALTAAVATSFKGMVLENPSTSNKNYVMLTFSWATTVAVPSATIIGLMTGVDAGDAAIGITPRNRKIGSSITSAAIIDDDCTLVGTPVREALYASAWAEATTAGTLQPPNLVDIDGAITLTPGAYVATYSAVTETASFWFTMVWAEISV